MRVLLQFLYIRLLQFPGSDTAGMSYRTSLNLRRSVRVIGRQNLVGSETVNNAIKQVDKFVENNPDGEPKEDPSLKVAADRKKSVVKLEKKSSAVTFKSLSRDAELQFNKPFSCIIGLDEAGRGPLAGPVVAAACIVDEYTYIDGVMDSKKVTKEEDREKIFEELTSNHNVKWSVVRVEHTEIDEVNILKASLIGMRRATAELLNKIGGQNSSYIALVDGPYIPDDMPIEAKPVIKGDSTMYSIAAASIIAKVTRDRIMRQYHEIYPAYDFKQHKGYPTAAHIAALQTHGPCEIHRVSYAPVQRALRSLQMEVKGRGTNEPFDNPTNINGNSNGKGGQIEVENSSLSRKRRSRAGEGGTGTAGPSQWAPRKGRVTKRNTRQQDVDLDGRGINIVEGEENSSVKGNSRVVRGRGRGGGADGPRSY